MNKFDTSNFIFECSIVSMIMGGIFAYIFLLTVKDYYVIFFIASSSFLIIPSYFKHVYNKKMEKLKHQASKVNDFDVS